ncbi:hypothetical protein QA612_16675 [Evansella sp. AB-P1]|uniref:hypothetical protein n=1 Tax=Evansella sp. AB-P1 TaxID=3037653 RepID=UPI00241CA41C|nr:hypothetical protein [Evansella sp. AB-P1]MDG5789093.1 hypothetical protein [Evansella sp. AB-P1]
MYYIGTVNYLTLAKSDSTYKEDINIKEIIKKVVEVTESYAILRGVHIEKDVTVSY